MSLFKRSTCALALAAALLLALPSSTPAAVTFVDNRANFTAHDVVQWGVVGSPGSIRTSPFSTLTAFSRLVGVSKPGGFFERLDQGNWWDGNFAPGDQLIWTTYSAHPYGPIAIQFEHPVMGVGTQIQTDLAGPFTGTIEAFDSGGNSLGFFSRVGNSTSAADNSAIFMGIVSDQVNISRIQFNAINEIGQPRAFAINRVDIRWIPEPASAALLLPGLVLLLRRRA